MEPFKKIVIKENNEEIIYNLESITLSKLSEDEVLIKVGFSSLNHKTILFKK